MKTQIVIVAALVGLMGVVACEDKPAPPAPGAAQAQPSGAAAKTTTEAPKAAELNLPADPTNIVNIAANSKDHSTLVTALKSADYLYSVASPGPFTVFAPTNAAFDKLPKGTIDGLLKPDKQEDLKNILKHHVAVSVYQAKDFKDGQVLSMADGGKVTMHVKDGKVTVNDANIVASVPASNGIVHIIDGVLLPK